jgi:glycosyltransferase involved in cell wall biosynthesis
MPNKQKKRIAIVTWDLLGPAKSGGIGTACAGLAETLANAGHEVTICFLPSDTDQVVRFDHWVEEYAAKKIELLFIPGSATALEASPGARASYIVYEFLRDKFPTSRWDVIHFPEMRGLGFYSLKARKTIGRFAGSVMTTICHGSSRWHRSFNGETKPTLGQAETDYLENASIQESDFIFAPTAFANLLPEIGLTPYTGKRSHFNEIAFLGRLETRKGIEIFVDGILSIDPEFFVGKKILFLGRTSSVSGVDARTYIETKLSPSGINFEIVDGLSSKSALGYLLNRNPLVVLPSLSETIGYSLLECLELDLPVIASQIPAFENIVDPESHSDLFFGLGSNELASKIQQVDADGFRSLQRRFDNEEAKAQWLEWHESLPEPTFNREHAEAPANEPLVSICIPHRNRSSFLQTALASLETQTYSNFEILIGDDASDRNEIVAVGDILGSMKVGQKSKLVRFESQNGPGAVRNELAKMARGEFLFFMDDDNLAHPNEIESFVKAQNRTGADLLSCPFNRVRDDKFVCKWLPLGPAKVVGYFVNSYGDTNSMIRKSVFADVGGFDTTMNFGGEDWELLMRATMKGHSLEIIPEALMTYREHDGNYSKRVDSERSRGIFIESFAKNADRKSVGQVMEIVERGHRGWDELYLPESREAFVAPKKISKVIFRPHPREIIENSYINGYVKAEILGDELFMEVTEDDAIIELPEFEVPKNQRLHLRVDISASRPSRLSVYTLKPGMKIYTEECCVRHFYAAGENSFGLDLGNEITGKIRIDPSEHKGSFVISSLVFSEIPDAKT